MSWSCISEGTGHDVNLTIPSPRLNTWIEFLYGIVIGGLPAFGAGLARLRTPSSVQANEGMVLVAIMFLFTSLVVSYPMMD